LGGLGGVRGAACARQGKRMRPPGSHHTQYGGWDRRRQSGGAEVPMRTMLRESATRRVNDWGSAMRKGCESRDNPRGHTPRGGGILATPATDRGGGTSGSPQSTRVPCTVWSKALQCGGGGISRLRGERGRQQGEGAKARVPEGPSMERRPSHAPVGPGEGASGEQRAQEPRDGMKSVGG